MSVSCCFPWMISIAVDAVVSRSCGWEDEDEIPFNPDELWDHGYGSLDGLEEVSADDECDDLPEDDYEPRSDNEEDLDDEHDRDDQDNGRNGNDEHNP